MSFFDGLSRQTLFHLFAGQLVIQFTNHCNAKCPQCGMSISRQIHRTRLSVPTIKKIIDAAAQRNIQSISFTGGEPLLFLDDLTELIEYAKQAGILFVRTGTNGFVFMNPGKNGFYRRLKKTARKLYDSGLRNFWISIDSVNPSLHEKMRGLPDVIGGIRKGLKIFHDTGLFPSANLGINRNMAGWLTAGFDSKDFSSEQEYLECFFERFKTGFESFIHFVIQLGFTMVSFCYPMSTGHDFSSGLDPVYGAASSKEIVKFSSREKSCMFSALRIATERFRHQIRIFTPQCSLYSLSRHYCENKVHTFPCRGGLDYFFIDALDGLTYPCGYRGKDNLGEFEQGKVSTERSCRLCDWECFRDPSELLGPFYQLTSEPLKLFKKIKSDPEFFRYWIKDIRYYHACDFFDGRKPLSREKLRKFRVETSEENGIQTVSMRHSS